MFLTAFVTLLIMFSLPLFGEEIVIRFAPEVSITIDPSKPLQKYSSSDAAIQQILDQHPPQNISRLFNSYQGTNFPDKLQNIQVWQLESSAEAQNVLQKLSMQPGIVYAEPNHTYRIFADANDPLFPEQWYLQKTNVPAAWDIELGSSSVIVGVIDTGVDYLHEDLQGQLWVNDPEDLNQNGKLDSLDLNGIDDDGNGYVDDVIGWDFTHAPNFPDQGDYLDPDNDPMDEYGSGHGTPVAGIIAAKLNNQIGMSGIAPGVRVMPLRAGTASGFLEEDDVAEAILYSIANGCKVVNMSFGDVAVSYLLKDAIEYGVGQGLIFVASAGNSGNSNLNYPAAYDETLSAGATDSTNRLAGFSNYGSKINLVAPGQELLSTQIGDDYGPNNGTSFSAPLISAAVAMIWSHYPNYSPEQVKGALFAGCRDLGFFGWDPFYGHGLVDFEKSLKISGQGYAEITVPGTGSGSAENEIAIRGTAFSSRLFSYSLSYGFGENPFQWTPITEVFSTQVLQDTLTVWNISSLPDSAYTLELRLKQYGMPDILHKNVFYIDHSPPTLSGLDSTAILIGPQNGFLIRFRSDDLTTATLLYRAKDDPEFNLSKLSQYFQDEHNFILSQEDITGEVEFFIHLKNAAGLEAVYDNNGQYYSLNLTETFPYQNILLQKQQHAVSGFLMPFTTNFNENNTPEFVISELIDGEKFGPLNVWEYSGSQYNVRQLTNFPLIPRDAGKIYSDKGLELLGGFGSNSLLLGGNQPGEFPNTIVWDDTTNFWASRLANFDTDPELELLAIHFGRWCIFDISPDHQVSLQQTLLTDTTSGNNRFGVPWALMEDLDEDGLREIIVEDIDGDLVIYEEDTAGQYQFTWSTRLPGRGGNSLLRAADVTGDGTKELITAVRNVPDVLRESNVNTKFWALTIWKATGDNIYEKVGQKNFDGVTVQAGVHNGLSTADLNGDGFSEIIFTPFPDAYIFTFAQQEFQFLWYREGINSNTAVSDDFDGNGLVDVIINSVNGMLQFEFAGNSNRPLPPLQMQATPLDTIRIRLNWREAPGADYYKIYRKSGTQTVFTFIDSTISAAFLDSALNKDSVYTYAVTQVDFSYPEAESGFSRTASAQPNTPPVFLNAGVLQARQILLYFNEPMSDDAYQTDNFLLTKSGNHPASAIRGENRRQVLLSFLEDFPSGINQLEMNGLSDTQGTPLPQQPLAIEFEYYAAAEPFYARSIEYVNKQHLRLHFNRPTEVASAENPQHYSLEPDGNIISVKVDSSNSSTVSIYISGDTRMGGLGIPYYLTVQNVKDRQGNLLDASKANRLAIIISAETLAEVMVYPNPFTARTAQQDLMFANLPRGTEILIFTATGHYLQRLEENQGAGGIPWDLRTEDGSVIGSGVYIYLARLNGEEKKGKFMIIR
jgi:subtilisin family serine protease